MLFNDAVNCGDYIMLVTDGGISRANWWNETDRGKREYSEKNLSQLHFVHYIVAVLSYIFKDSARTTQ